MIGVGRRGCIALPITVGDLAGRDFLERDRQVVLRGGVDHRRRELLEGALTQIVVVRVDLPGTLGGHDHARIRGVDMLEQAVYAGRNHTWILAAALTVLLSAPAHADAVRVAIDEDLGALVAAPDGGVWAGSARGVIRVRPDGRSTLTPAKVGSGRLGPDGLAYFVAAEH